jgi:predicted DCC family thiol-disulfide oxidoreductase YuxK
VRPLLLYDGHCAFCRRWVDRWHARTGDAVAYRPSRRARRAVQLIDSDGKRYQGADAVFRALSHAPRMRLVSTLGRWPVVRWLAGRAYRFIAGHRTSAARVDRLLFGTSTAAPTRGVVRWLFLRCLGGVYLIAFSSLRVQVLGLYGSRGIEPIGERLSELRARAGRDAYRLAPTLLWLASSDRDLVRFCRAGQLGAVALMLDIAPRSMLVALWALYLSFVSVGRDFLSFQWDALLLETGVHAMLVSGRARTAGRNRPGEPPWLGALLMRWLVFRLHFQSGLVKLQSRDPSWRRCTACAYHYQTQPLPTRIGWYASHLPRPLQRLSTAAALAIELGAPPLAFAPRRPRKAAFSALTGLQLLIAATGNYAFFNLLTIALGLWVLDDSSFGGVRRVAGRRARRRRATGAWLRVPLRVAHTALAALVAVVSAATFTRRAAYRPLARARPLARVAARLSALVEPVRSINPYGLFAMMTTDRPEIVIEGSDDGDAWREYHFRYKPSRPEDPPRWVAPHQPRLDWQMWFAALGAPPAWFAALLSRLLQGVPDVLGLLAGNPFPDHPPRYLRALLYDYRMTDRETRRRTGAWWHRKLIGTYFPTSTLER